jgi:hypothetical protein
LVVAAATAEGVRALVSRIIRRWSSSTWILLQ